MSKRKNIALDIADFARDNNLTIPYGGYAGQSDCKGRPHVVLFCKPRTLDGSVYVFSETYISISWNNRRSIVFDSPDKVKEFLKLAFVEHKMDKAEKIERKK